MVRMDPTQYGLAVAKAVGDRLKRLRLSRLKSRADLAALSGWSESTIQRWERGSRTPEIQDLAVLLVLLEEFTPVEDWLKMALKDVPRPGRQE